MPLLHPDTRSQVGRQRQEELLGETPVEPATLFESSWRDYVFAEVWTRPNLDLRSRYLITLCGAASADTPTNLLEAYVRGALQAAHLSLEELREAALHLAVYSGWSRAARLDAALTKVAQDLGLAIEPSAPLRAEPWHPEDRLRVGADVFSRVNTFEGPPPATAYFEGGILNFVFGEMWNRPGLDMKARRWVTLVGVADATTEIPVRTHVYAAMASGDVTYSEIDEFVLQYAIHGGWPKASYMQNVILDMAKKLKEGLTWDGKPREDDTRGSA